MARKAVLDVAILMSQEALEGPKIRVKGPI